MQLSSISIQMNPAFAYLKNAALDLAARNRINVGILHTIIIFIFNGRIMAHKSDEADEVLGKLIKKDQLQAFDQLYDRYSQNLYRFARSFLKTNEDAEEVVQEVYFRLWDKRHGLSEHKSLQSYLFTITYHVVIDQLRLRVKDQNYEQYLLREAQRSFSTPDAVLEYEELKKQLEKAVDELPKRRKQVFQMSRDEGLSNREIADRNQISIKTVETHITLALQHIRKRLGRNNLGVVIFLFLFVYVYST